VRVREIYRLSASVDGLLRPEERQRIAERCATLDQSNGAGELAAFIEEMAYSRKIDRPQLGSWPCCLQKASGGADRTSKVLGKDGSTSPATARSSDELIGSVGAPGGIRTPDPQIRNLMLYPAELRARAAALL
jgi:hypothetical protein